jgi:putative membrane protein
MFNALPIRAAAAAAALLLGTVAWAKDAPGQAFITQAIQGNLAEVSLGKLAQEKASRDDVKSFGQMLEQDHTTANQQAEAAASAMNVPPPTGPNARQKAAYDRLSKLSGAAFDRRFVQLMVADHRRDVAEYQKEAKRSDGQVSDYAKATLPTLQKHLQTARSLMKGAPVTQ